MTDYESLCADFYQIPWFTYRSGFPRLESTEMTSDVGWGCMVRSGQMGIALALKILQMDKEDWICGEEKVGWMGKGSEIV